MTLHNFTTSVAFLASFALLGGCQEESAQNTEPSKPEVIPHEKTMPDRFAGKVVKDEQHAYEMIHERLYNAPKTGTLSHVTEFIAADSNQSLRLADLHTKQPVVLIFGSASCPNTSANLIPIESLTRRFGSKVKFYFIYLREAHPRGGFHPPLNDLYAKAVKHSIKDADSMMERCQTALLFAKSSGLSLRILIDRMDDAAAVKWSGWPARLFVIDTDGSVVYSGGQGPWRYNIDGEFIHTKPNPGLTQLLEQPYEKESLADFLEKWLATK